MTDSRECMHTDTHTHTHTHRSPLTAIVTFKGRQSSPGMKSGVLTWLKENNRPLCVCVCVCVYTVAVGQVCFSAEVTTHLKRKLLIYLNWSQIFSQTEVSLLSNSVCLLKSYGSVYQSQRKEKEKLFFFSPRKGYFSRNFCRKQKIKKPFSTAFLHTFTNETMKVHVQ